MNRILEDIKRARTELEHPTRGVFVALPEDVEQVFKTAEELARDMDKIYDIAQRWEESDYSKLNRIKEIARKQVGT